MGPNVPDPRRPGQSLTCMSCHSPHASDQKAMLLAAPDRDLCVQCHQQLN
jgi:predicted CXXCH cytochrome family protein